MRKIFILNVIMLFSITLLFPAKAKIFFVNLYNESADMRLGEEKAPVFYMNGLDSYTVTRMNVTQKIGTYKLYFKTSSGDKWYFWGDESGNAYDCSIKDGDVICVLFGYEGSVHYYVLKEPKGPGAFVCLINGTDETLPKMSVSKYWEDESIASMKNIGSNAVSNFGLIKPDNYGLFWQFEDQLESEGYYYYPDDNNDILMFDFENARYYLFMTYVVDGTKYSVRYDISPK